MYRDMYMNNKKGRGSSGTPDIRLKYVSRHMSITCTIHKTLFIAHLILWIKRPGTKIEIVISFSTFYLACFHIAFLGFQNKIRNLQKLLLDLSTGPILAQYRKDFLLIIVFAKDLLRIYIRYCEKKLDVFFQSFIGCQYWANSGKYWNIKHRFH